MTATGHFVPEEAAFGHGCVITPAPKESGRTGTAEFGQEQSYSPRTNCSRRSTMPPTQSRSRWWLQSAVTSYRHGIFTAR